MRGKFSSFLNIIPIRKEAESIDPHADWENSTHPWIGIGLTKRQDEAIEQARLNLKTNPSD